MRVTIRCKEQRVHWRLGWAAKAKAAVGILLGRPFSVAGDFSIDGDADLGSPVQVVELRAGDLVAVCYEQHLSKDQSDKLRDSWLAATGFKAIVLDGGAKVGPVLRSSP